MRKIEVDLGELMDMYFAGVTNYMNPKWLLGLFPPDFSENDIEEYKKTYLKEEKGYGEGDWQDADDQFRSSVTSPKSTASTEGTE